MTLREQFEHTWPLLEKAVERFGGAFEKHHIWAEIEAERAQLFATPNAALVSRVEMYPTGMKELRLWLGGGDMDDLLKMQPIVVQFARSVGCKRMLIEGRPGWARVFKDAKPLAVTLVQEI